MLLHTLIWFPDHFSQKSTSIEVEKFNHLTHWRLLFDARKHDFWLRIRSTQGFLITVNGKREIGFNLIQIIQTYILSNCSWLRHWQVRVALCYCFRIRLGQWHNMQAHSVTRCTYWILCKHTLQVTRQQCDTRGTFLWELNYLQVSQNTIRCPHPTIRMYIARWT